jgi:Domain of unknown function (DUF2760)
LSRIVLAFRSFFAILFTGRLPADIAQKFGFTQSRPQPGARPAAPAAKPAAPAPARPVPQAAASDGALQILGILQRDSRLIDFLMEDISAYSDEQVGAAVRNLHDQSRESLGRYLSLAPVIDGVEGSFTKLDSNDPSTVKLLGNVPATGKAAGGVLRHKGWRAQRIELPPLPAGQNASVIAPAEVEIE